jgi:adenosylcobinamide kinase/adenosylcobinamide-phosphate guanylyltransferase
MLTVVLGGARSGKSGHALSLAAGRSVVYIATARRDEDPEMQDRIARHRASRPAGWVTVEEPLDIARAVRQVPQHTLVIVDCITVWISNLMWESRAVARDVREATVLTAVDHAIEAARNRDVITVSNDVGGGIVPDDPVGRQFRDLQGLANQRLSQAADSVVWLVAGLPIMLKGGL